MATNEMNAKLISQAEVVTALESDSLIPVSAGAGQPQKNVAYSTLESKVVAAAKSNVDAAYNARVSSLESSVTSINSKNDKQDARLGALEQNISSAIGALLATFTLEASSDPSFNVTNRDAADVYISHMGGYLFYNGNADGKVYAAKLNPADWSKFADGTAVTTEIEAATETMVHVPDCHFKASGKTMNFGGIVPIDGGKTFGSPHWVGAYKGQIAGGALHSRPNVAPSHSQTMSSFWSYAQALHAGKQYGLANYGFHQLVNALYQARYGNLDSQSTVGAGFQTDTDTWETARDLAMGKLKSLGDGTGKVYYTDGTVGDQYPVKLFGFEDLWGKLWELRPGIRFEMRDNVRYAIVYDGNQVSNTATGREFVTAVQSASREFAKSMKLGEYWDLTAEAVGGSGTTYYCDGYWASTGGELLPVGGSAYDGSQCGLSCAASNRGFSFSDANIGARLAFWSDPVILGGSELVAMING